MRISSIGNSIISAVLAVVAVVLLSPAAVSALGDAAAVVFFFYFGLLFYLAYRFADRLFLLKAIEFLCTHLSFPRRREMALVYAAGFFVASAVFFVKMMIEH